MSRICGMPPIEEDPMGNKVVVLAVFANEAEADSAAKTLKESGLASHDAIGVLALNEKGEVKTEKVGKRSTGRGAGIGLALALLTSAGLGVGLIGGALVGALRHTRLGLGKPYRELRAPALTDGKAAVGVLAAVSEADSVS